MKCQECNHELDSVSSYHAYNPESEGVDIFYLCDDCALVYGFCFSCGTMAAGANDDWLARHEICYECWSEMLDELDSSSDERYDY